MRLYEIGRVIRERREARGYTQAQLATLAGIARSTLNRLENGAENDIGFKKLATLLELLGAELAVHVRAEREEPDYVARAAASASVSASARLYADEVAQAVITGRPAPGKAGLLQLALDELSQPNRAGIIKQIGARLREPQRAAAGLERLERTLAEKR